MLSRLVITFLPRRKRPLISWLQSPSAVILEPPKIKSDTVFPSISHEVMGPDAMILVFWMLSFKPTFSLFSLTFHQEALYFSFTFCHKDGVICISEVTDISHGNLDSSLCFLQPSVSHCTQYASKFGKLSSSHRTAKGQFSFQPQRKAMLKNIQTTMQLHSSHRLAN